MRGRGKNGRKSIWRYNGQNFSEFDQNVNLHLRGCSSVVEHLLCMYEALGSIPGISRSDLSCCSDGKESACHAGDPGLICGLERASGEGHGNPLQCSCLENSMGRGAWGATVHRVAKSWTRLGDQTRSTQGQHYPAFHQWKKKKWNWNPVTSESLLSVFFFWWVLVAARFQRPWLQSSLISTVQCWPRVMHVVTMPYVLGWLKSLPETWIRSLGQ